MEKEAIYDIDEYLSLLNQDEMYQLILKIIKLKTNNNDESLEEFVRTLNESEVNGLYSILIDELEEFRSFNNIIIYKQDDELRLGYTEQRTEISTEDEDFGYEFMDFLTHKSIGSIIPTEEMLLENYKNKLNIFQDNNSYRVSKLPQLLEQIKELQAQKKLTLKPLDIKEIK